MARNLSLARSARLSLGNVDTYGSAFPGGSMIDLSIEGHMLDGQPGGDPRLGTDPAPATPRRFPVGLLLVGLAVVIVAGM